MRRRLGIVGLKRNLFRPRDQAKNAEIPFENHPCNILLFSQQRVEVEPARDHGDFTGGGLRPFRARAVAIEFDAVQVGIVEIERLADAVIGSAVELDAGAGQAAQGIGQRGAVGVANGEVKKSDRPWRRWRSARALPRV